MADLATRPLDGILRRMVYMGDGTFAQSFAAAGEPMGPTDLTTRGPDGIIRRLSDNGDGTYSEVIAVTGVEAGAGGVVDGGTP